MPQNEIIVIATQYDTIGQVKNTLRLAGVDDIERYLDEGTLFILDAQQGYQAQDSFCLGKLGMSLLSRVKRNEDEGLQGLPTLAHFSVLRKLKS